MLVESRIESLMSSALEKIKQTVQSNTVVGDVIEIEGKILLPITKVTMGIVAGGGEYPTSEKQIKQTKQYPFAGGTGTGISVEPIGFLCIENGKVHLLKIDALSPLEKLVENLPKLAEAIANGIKEKTCENN